MPFDTTFAGLSARADGFYSPLGSYSRFVYVGGGGGGNYVVVDPVTPFVTGPFTPGWSAMAVTNSGLIGYASAGNHVNVLDLTNNTVTTTITIAGASGCGSVCLTPNEAYLYVCDSTPGHVYVISTATNSLVANLPITNAFDVVISPDGTKAYVGGGSSITVIDVATHTISSVNSILHRMELGMDISANGGTLYYGSTATTGVVAVDSFTFSVVAVISIGTNQCYGLKVNNAGTFLYVAEYVGGIGIVSLPSNTLLTTVSYSGELFAIDVSADDSMVYAADALNNFLVILNASSHTVVATIATGAIQPASIGLNHHSSTSGF